MGCRGRWAWRVLLAVAVNAITFGTKRAFHGVLRVTRKRLVEMGLTAARFDLLSVLVKCRPGPLCAPGLRQSAIRRILGVTAPVVTRMVRALERLGLVRRWREQDWDRRQVLVALTEAGERCILKAREVMLPAVSRAVLSAICFGEHRSASARFRHMDTLESYLRSLRRRFGDGATLYYPWGHPDD
jgi:DNA-binding MarR family transcriptional regulator